MSPVSDRSVRSMLFVPGSRPDMMAKAAASVADAVCLDLEDSVTPDEKPASRGHVVKALLDLDFGARVRLVRHGGAAPSDVAFPGAHAIDRSFVRCLRALVGGANVTVATHDRRLIEIAGALASGVDQASNLTYQFRFDGRMTLANELVALGARVSTLLPFGPGWPYGSAVRG